MAIARATAQVYTIAHSANSPSSGGAVATPKPRTEGGDEGANAQKVEAYVSPTTVLSQPYLVVNIGSGGSFLKVRPVAVAATDSSGGGGSRFERCGGTALGEAQPRYDRWHLTPFSLCVCVCVCV